MPRYTVVLLPQPEGGYVVHVPGLNDIATCGDTVDDALDMARDLIETALADLVTHGDELPTEHGPAVVASVEVPLPVAIEEPA
jgi:antitoxin HicB